MSSGGVAYELISPLVLIAAPYNAGVHAIVMKASRFEVNPKHGLASATSQTLGNALLAGASKCFGFRALSRKTHRHEALTKALSGIFTKPLGRIKTERRKKVPLREPGAGRAALLDLHVYRELKKLKADMLSLISMPHSLHGWLNEDTQLEQLHGSNYRVSLLHENSTQHPRTSLPSLVDACRRKA